MKKLLFVPLLLLVFVQCGNQSQLEILAKAVNLTLPQQLDEVTVLDSCTVIDGKILKYHCTLNFENFENLSAPIFKLYQKKEVIAGLRGLDQKDLKKIYEIGSIIEYGYYHDKKEFVSIQISKDDYQNYGNLKSDDAVFSMLQETIQVLKETLPEHQDTGTLTDGKVEYPRTVIFEIQDLEYEQGSGFDSLEFKKIRMDEYFEFLDQNLLSDLIGVDANLNYRYVFRDANDNYLATVESTIADYKASKDVD